MLRCVLNAPQSLGEYLYKVILLPLGEDPLFYLLYYVRIPLGKPSDSPLCGNLCCVFHSCRRCWGKTLPAHTYEEQGQGKRETRKYLLDGGTE